MPGTQLVTPDAASNALQAWDMLHGNVLLHGWAVSDVSFCITELPEYLVLDMVRGPGPDVVHVASAFTYTLLVLLVNYAACLPRVTRRRQAWLPPPALAGAHNPAARRHNDQLCAVMT
jgi:hypothetical protein